MACHMCGFGFRKRKPGCDFYGARFRLKNADALFRNTSNIPWFRFPEQWQWQLFVQLSESEMDYFLSPSHTRQRMKILDCRYPGQSSCGGKNPWDRFCSVQRDVDHRKGLLEHPNRSFVFSYVKNSAESFHGLLQFNSLLGGRSATDLARFGPRR